MANDTQSAPHTISVSLEGAKDAALSFDGTLFWLTRSNVTDSKDTRDPSKAFTCVPLDLILDCSFVEDSDGGSLYVRLLAPPSQQASPLFPFAKVKSRASAVVDTEHTLPKVTDRSSLSAKERSERLLAHLEGACQKLRLLKIEARVASGEKARDWVAELLAKAYCGLKPYRRLKVLVNPVGGPGKARQLFQQRVRPILEAAGCKLDVQVTERVQHGLQIAKELKIEDYDAILLVSGDGLAHEILNGFAQRPDAAKALKLPMVPIPAGSGNGLCVNLLGPEQGFNLALASLNAIKGQSMPLDICTVTQPKGKARARSSRYGGGTAEAVAAPSSSQDDPVALSGAPELPYDQYYSFLSQAIGLMADVDLGTEHLRALGDTRFVLGYLSGVISNTECPVDIDVKLGERGTKNKKLMREKVKTFNETGQWEDEDGSGTHENGEASASTLRHGAVTEALYEGEAQLSPPLLSGVDPSWPHTILSPTQPPSQDPPSGSWCRLPHSISTLYAGKIPFVARDLMQFPYALPGDGTVDIALQLHEGGRAGKLRAINGAETGSVVYDRAVLYLKVEAYRVTPRLAQGDARLKKGGLVSIDGEHRPYAPFQVEVAGLQARTLSLFGRFNVREVPQPAAPTQ